MAISRWDYVSFLYFYLQQLEGFAFRFIWSSSYTGENGLMNYSNSIDFAWVFFLFVLIITQILGGTMGVLRQRLEYALKWFGLNIDTLSNNPSATPPDPDPFSRLCTPSRLCQSSPVCPPVPSWSCCCYQFPDRSWCAYCGRRTCRCKDRTIRT